MPRTTDSIRVAVAAIDPASNAAFPLPIEIKLIPPVMRNDRHAAFILSFGKTILPLVSLDTDLW